MHIHTKSCVWYIVGGKTTCMFTCYMYLLLHVCSPESLIVYVNHQWECSLYLSITVKCFESEKETLGTVSCYYVIHTVHVLSQYIIYTTIVCKSFCVMLHISAYLSLCTKLRDRVNHKNPCSLKSQLTSTSWQQLITHVIIENIDCL